MPSFVCQVGNFHKLNIVEWEKIGWHDKMIINDKVCKWMEEILYATWYVSLVHSRRMPRRRRATRHGYNVCLLECNITRITLNTIRDIMKKLINSAVAVSAD